MTPRELPTRDREAARGGDRETATGEHRGRGAAIDDSTSVRER